MRSSSSAVLTLLIVAACGGSASSLGAGPSLEPDPTSSAPPGSPTATEGPADAAPDGASTGDGSRDGSQPTASGPCALPSGASAPAIVAPPTPSEWHVGADDLRGSLDPDPLRKKWAKDTSRLWVDVYARGLDLGALEVSLGTCKLGPGGQVGQSVPGNSPQAPPTTEYGARFESVSFADAAWATFRFVPGARYVVEAKLAGAVVARLVARVPDELLALSSATRTNVTWTPPAGLGSGTSFALIGVQMDATTHQTVPPSLSLSVAAGSATWDGSNPVITYALAWWPRKLEVQGLVRSAHTLHSATFNDYWYHAL